MVYQVRVKMVLLGLLFVGGFIACLWPIPTGRGLIRAARGPPYGTITVNRGRVLP